MQKTPLALLAGRNLFDLIEWKHGGPKSGVVGKAERPIEKASSSVVAMSRQAPVSRGVPDGQPSFVLTQDRGRGQSRQNRGQDDDWDFGEPLPRQNPNHPQRRTNGGRRSLPDGSVEIQVRRGTRVYDRDGRVIAPNRSDDHSDYYIGRERDGFPDYLHCGWQTNPDGRTHRFHQNCRTRLIS